MSLSDAERAAFERFERSGWDQAADAYDRLWAGVTLQSADPMLDAAAVGPGTRVLDLATGAGHVAALAAGRGADAVGADFSPAQIALARRLHPGVDFVQADAGDLPFDDEAFDAVVIGFGMNHFPRPDRVASEIRRVLRPGGLLAFTVWAAPQPGQVFGIVLSAIDRLGETAVDLPEGPPYFQFADADRVRALLAAEGFADISTRLVPQVFRHDTPDDLFHAFHDGAVRATAILRSQTETARAAIAEAVRAEVTKLRAGDGYVVPAPAALSAARKP